MASDLSVLIIAVVFAVVVTLLVELLRLQITKRTVMIISIPAIAFLLLIVLLPMFFPDKKSDYDQEQAIQTAMSEERLAVLADLKKDVEEQQKIKDQQEIEAPILSDPETMTRDLDIDALVKSLADAAAIQDPIEVTAPEQTVQEETGATESVPDIDAGSEKEIRDFLDRWLAAWEGAAGENGDMLAFGDFYAAGFSAGNLDRTAWMAKKAGTNRKKTWIKVELSDIRIALEGEIARVGFQQDYSSSNYAEKAAMALGLQKTDGAWKIVSAE